MKNELELRTLIFAVDMARFVVTFLNGFASRLRDECLDREQLQSLSVALMGFKAFQQDDYHPRPHRHRPDQRPTRSAAKLTSSWRSQGSTNRNREPNFTVSGLTLILIQGCESNQFQ